MAQRLQVPQALARREVFIRLFDVEISMPTQMDGME
jgi:hypothetical protein